LANPLANAAKGLLAKSLISVAEAVKMILTPALVGTMFSLCLDALNFNFDLLKTLVAFQEAFPVFSVKAKLS
jgi:hypothetical protein